MRRVCSYPPRHDYVDRLHGVAVDLVERDEEWPRLPRFWNPAWVAANAHRWDDAHLHFTWEQYPLATVAAVLDAHRAAGRRIVWTAHDLQNPHRRDDRWDGAALALLASRADRVVTLTSGAAIALRERVGVEATVVPHGPLADVDTMHAARSRPRRPGPTRVLLHAKSLRANLDWAAVVLAARVATGRGLDVRVDVDVHDEPAIVAAVRSVAGPGVAVTAHRRRGFRDLCARIAHADAIVLPYRWGTHSGLAELATDLGTTVIASDAGFVGDQVPAVVVARVAGSVDVGLLADAFADVATGAVPAPVAIATRQRDLATFVDAHRWPADPVAASGEGRTSSGAGSRQARAPRRVRLTGR